MKFRACKDNKEGWVTTVGNKGKEFLRAEPRYYLCLQETPVHAGVGAEAAVVRVLMQGEAFKAFEEPKKVNRGDQRVHYRVRASLDGAEGWVSSIGEKQIQAW